MISSFALFNFPQKQFLLVMMKEHLLRVVRVMSQIRALVGICGYLFRLGDELPLIPKFRCPFKFTFNVANIFSFSVVSAAATLSTVVPTLCDLEKELCSVKNRQELAICLGLEQYEVKAIEKSEQVCCILLCGILS